jgi:hypothetical protein
MIRRFFVALSLVFLTVFTWSIAPALADKQYSQTEQKPKETYQQSQSSKQEKQTYKSLQEDQSYYSKGQSQQDYSDKGTKYTQETQADSKPSTKE